jgi:hypothetical protein
LARGGAPCTLGVMSSVKREVCPACGGAGGGPFGRANSGWDIETYECLRCEGWGYIRESVDGDEPASAPRPGIVKTTAPRVTAEKDKRRSSGG